MRILRDFWRDGRGTATIEFVIVFPVIVAMFLAIVETGWLTTRSVFLERGLDIATRDLRLGATPGITHDQLRQNVCENAIILVNCNRDLILEVVEMDLASAYPQNQANCIDRTGALTPTVTFDAGGRNRIMFVRACMIVDPIFPGIGVGLGLPKDASGGHQMVSYTAFMSEP